MKCEGDFIVPIDTQEGFRPLYFVTSIGDVWLCLLETQLNFDAQCCKGLLQSQY